MIEKSMENDPDFHKMMIEKKSAWNMNSEFRHKIIWQLPDLDGGYSRVHNGSRGHGELEGGGRDSRGMGGGGGLWMGVYTQEVWVFSREGVR